MIKEIYVHVIQEGDRRVYHIHDNPEYTVMFWYRAKDNFGAIRGEKVTVYHTPNDSIITDEEIVQIVLPFLKADYPELIRQKRNEKI